MSIHCYMGKSMSIYLQFSVEKKKIVLDHIYYNYRDNIFRGRDVLWILEYKIYLLKEFDIRVK